MHLTLKIDFKKQRISGNSILTLDMAYQGGESVLLNANQQKIHNITDEATGEILKHVNESTHIKVILPKPSSKQMKIRISYTIIAGLVWLKPSQTVGKKRPFVFSMGWREGVFHCPLFPCQHTNLVKTTFSAHITGPAWSTALMSATHNIPPRPFTNVKSERLKLTPFLQTLPISSYLVALAAGALQSEKLGTRTRVWAESEILETAAKDFSETENMLNKAEAICGPYVWKNYDILVLPPAFAYGGMENPCMT